MTDLHAIQAQLVARITAAPVGSALRFALMDAADAVSKAIAAEERERPGAEIEGNRPETQTQPASQAGAELQGNRS